MGIPCISIFSQRKEIRLLLLLHALIFTFAVLAYYIYYYCTLRGIIDKDGNPLGRDFIAFWTTVALLKNGEIQNVYSLTAFSKVMQTFMGHDIAGLDFRYPPQFLFLLWPLKYIDSYRQAYCVWSLFNVGIFTFALFWRSQSENIWWWILVSAPAVLINVFVGQTGLLTAAFLIGGFRLLAVAPILAGTVFALDSFKPQFFILIPFMLLTLRNYKAFFSMIVTLGLLFLVSAVAFGWQVWTTFIANTLVIQAHFAEAHIGKMITVYPNAVLIGLSSHNAMTVQMLVSAAVALITLCSLQKLDKPHWTDVLLLITPAIYLISPYGFAYDMSALSAVWIVWLAHQNRLSVNPLQTFLWLLLWYIPLFSHVLFIAKLPLITLLMAATFVVEWRRIRVSAHEI